MFSVRLVTADSYQAKPLPQLDPAFSEFRGSEIKHVPVIRIFGSTSNGQKTCLHIHGVFPYLFVPYTGEEDPGRLAYRLAASLDAAINVSLGSATSNNQHVYLIQRVSGVPYYGYHEKEHQFFKIYFYNPAMIKRAADLLQNGSVLGQSLQPHEAHIPYILQFMIDYNIHGMSMINLKGVKHRRATQSLAELQSSDQSVLSENSDIVYLPSTIERQSVCELEVDALASDVIRRNIESDVQLNPGLEAIWEEERARRAMAGFQGGDSQLVNPKSPTRPAFRPTDNDIYQQQRFARRLLMISQSDESLLTSRTNQSVAYAAEVPDGDNQLNSSNLTHLTLPSILKVNSGAEEESFANLTLSQEKFVSQVHTPDCSVLETEDMPLVDLLAQLAGNSIDNTESVDTDSVLGSQVLMNEDKSDNEDEDVTDLNLTCLQLDSWDSQETYKTSVVQGESSTSDKNPLGTSDVSPLLSSYENSSSSSRLIEESNKRKEKDSSSNRMPQYDGAGDISPTFLNSDDDVENDPTNIPEFSHLPKYNGTSEVASTPEESQKHVKNIENFSCTSTEYKNNNTTKCSTLYDRDTSEKPCSPYLEEVTETSNSPSVNTSVNNSQYDSISYEPLDGLLEIGSDFFPDLEGLQTSIEMGIMLSSTDSDAPESIGESVQEDKIPFEAVLNGDPCFTDCAELDKSDVTELRDQYASLLGNSLLPPVHMTRSPIDNEPEASYSSDSGILTNTEPSQVPRRDCHESVSSTEIPTDIQQTNAFSIVKDNVDSTKIFNVDSPESKEISTISNANSDLNCNTVATWAELQNLEFVEQSVKKRSCRTRNNGRRRRRRTRRKKCVTATSQTLCNDSQDSNSVPNNCPETAKTLSKTTEETITIKRPSCSTPTLESESFDLTETRTGRFTVNRVGHNLSSSFVANDLRVSNTTDDADSEDDSVFGHLHTEAGLAAFHRSVIGSTTPLSEQTNIIPDTLDNISCSLDQEMILVEPVLPNFDESHESRLEVSDEPENADKINVEGYSYYSSQKSHSALNSFKHRHCALSKKNKILQDQVFTSDELWIIGKRKRGRPSMEQGHFINDIGNSNCKIPIVAVTQLHQTKDEQLPAPEILRNDDTTVSTDTTYVISPGDRDSCEASNSINANKDDVESSETHAVVKSTKVARPANPTKKIDSFAENSDNDDSAVQRKFEENIVEFSDCSDMESLESSVESSVEKSSGHLQSPRRHLTRKGRENIKRSSRILDFEKSRPKVAGKVMNLRNSKKVENTVFTKQSTATSVRYEGAGLPGIPGIMPCPLSKKGSRAKRNMSKKSAKNSVGVSQQSKKSADVSVPSQKKIATSVLFPNWGAERETPKHSPTAGVIPILESPVLENRSPIVTPEKRKGRSLKNIILATSPVPKRNTSPRDAKIQLRFPKIDSDISSTPKKLNNKTSRLRTPKPSTEVVALKKMMKETKDPIMIAKLKELLKIRKKKLNIVKNQITSTETTPETISNERPSENEAPTPVMPTKNSPSPTPDTAEEIKSLINDSESPNTEAVETKLESADSSKLSTVQEVTKISETKDPICDQVSNPLSMSEEFDSVDFSSVDDGTTEIFDPELAIEANIIDDATSNPKELSFPTDQYANAVAEANFFAGKNYTIDAVSHEIPMCLFEEDFDSSDKRSSKNVSNNNLECSNEPSNVVDDAASESSVNHYNLDVFDVESLTPASTSTTDDADTTISSFTNTSELNDTNNADSPSIAKMQSESTDSPKKSPENETQTNSDHEETDASNFEIESPAFEALSPRRRTKTLLNDSFEVESPAFEALSPQPHVNIMLSQSFEEQFQQENSQDPKKLDEIVTKNLIDVNEESKKLDNELQDLVSQVNLQLDNDMNLSEIVEIMEFVEIDSPVSNDIDRENEVFTITENVANAMVREIVLSDILEKYQQFPTNIEKEDEVPTVPNINTESEINPKTTFEQVIDTREDQRHLSSTENVATTTVLETTLSDSAEKYEQLPTSIENSVTELSQNLQAIEDDKKQTDLAPAQNETMSSIPAIEEEKKQTELAPAQNETTSSIPANEEDQKQTDLAPAQNETTSSIPANEEDQKQTDLALAQNETTPSIPAIEEDKKQTEIARAQNETTPSIPAIEEDQKQTEIARAQNETTSSIPAIEEDEKRTDLAPAQNETTPSILAIEEDKKQAELAPAQNETTPSIPAIEDDEKQTDLAPAQNETTPSIDIRVEEESQVTVKDVEENIAIEVEIQPPISDTKKENLRESKNVPSIPVVLNYDSLNLPPTVANVSDVGAMEIELSDTPKESENNHIELLSETTEDVETEEFKSKNDDHSVNISNDKVPFVSNESCSSQSQKPVIKCRQVSVKLVKINLPKSQSIVVKIPIENAVETLESSRTSLQNDDLVAQSKIPDESDKNVEEVSTSIGKSSELKRSRRTRKKSLTRTPPTRRSTRIEKTMVELKNKVAQQETAQESPAASNTSIIENVQEIAVETSQSMSIQEIPQEDVVVEPEASLQVVEVVDENSVSTPVKPKRRSVTRSSQIEHKTQEDVSKKDTALEPVLLPANIADEDETSISDKNKRRGRSRTSLLLQAKETAQEKTSKEFADKTGEANTETTTFTYGPITENDARDVAAKKIVDENTEPRFTRHQTSKKNIFGIKKGLSRLRVVRERKLRNLRGSAEKERRENSPTVLQSLLQETTDESATKKFTIKTKKRGRRLVTLETDEQTSSTESSQKSTEDNSKSKSPDHPKKRVRFDEESIIMCKAYLNNSETLTQQDVVQPSPKKNYKLSLTHSSRVSPSKADVSTKDEGPRKVTRNAKSSKENLVSIQTNVIDGIVTERCDGVTDNVNSTNHSTDNVSFVLPSLQEVSSTQRPSQAALVKHTNPRNRKQTIESDGKLLIAKKSWNDCVIKKSSEKVRFLNNFQLFCPEKCTWRSKASATGAMQLLEPKVVLKRLTRNELKKHGIAYKSRKKLFVKILKKPIDSDFTVPAYDGAADLTSSDSEEDPDLTIVREENRVCAYESATKATSSTRDAIVTPKKRTRDDEVATTPTSKRRILMATGSTLKTPTRSPTRTSMLTSPGRISGYYSPLPIIITSPKVRKDASAIQDPLPLDNCDANTNVTSACVTPKGKNQRLHVNLLRGRITTAQSSVIEQGARNARAATIGSGRLGELGEIRLNRQKEQPLLSAPSTITSDSPTSKESKEVRKKLVFTTTEDKEPNESPTCETSAEYRLPTTDLEHESSRSIAISEHGEHWTTIDATRESFEVLDNLANPERNLVPESSPGSFRGPYDITTDEDNDNEEDSANVTFTQYVDSQINKNQALSMNHSKISTEQNKSITIRPKFNPPSRERILETMETYGIPKHRNLEPFFSEETDVSKQKELAQKMLKVPGKGFKNLPIFASAVEDLTGIVRWRKMKINQFNPSLSRLNDFKAKVALAGKDRVIIAPLIQPPTQKDVRNWLRARKYLERKKKRDEEAEEIERNLAKAPKIEDQVDGIRDKDECSSNASDSDVVELSPERNIPKNDAEKSSNVTLKMRLAKKGLFKKIEDATTSRLKLASDGEDPNDSEKANGSRETLARSNSVEIDSSLLSVLAKSKLFRVDEPSRHMGVSCGQIEFLSDTTRSNVGKENLQNAKALIRHQYLTIMCVEVHVATRGELHPDAQRDPIAAIFYSVQSDVPPTSKIKPLEHGAIVVADTQSAKNKMRYCHESNVPWSICFVNNEEALLNALVNLVMRIDPEILIGWELETLSWGYVFLRASNLGMNLSKRISRIPETQCLWDNKERTGGPDVDHLAEVKLPGRIVLDIWRLMRHEAALLSYTFENVMYHILNERIPCPSFKVLTDWWNLERPRSSRWRVVEHYTVRVLGVFRILDHLDIIGRTCELARLFGIQFYEVFSRGSQFRVESVMLRLAKPLNYIAVSPSPQQRASMRAMEALPLIMEPESMFYSDPLIVLDFQSLYPSIIIAHNYCFSTCLGRIEHIGQHEPFEFGAYSLRVSKSTALKLQGKINYAPCGVAYVKPEVRLGMLPRMLTEILETRFMVKKAMKDHKKDDKTLQRALHSRQMGLKFLANVTYGYTAANFSGRMPCIEVGDSVISKSKETLERAIKLVEQTPKWGARVVYGDTDSLFILVPGKTKAEAFVIGEEIADAVTAANPPPIKLKFEKVMYPAILQTKKRYCGYMYETPDQEKPTYLAKGIETVRRDGCPAVSKILEKTLKILFDTKDVSLVKKYVTRQLDKVLRCKVSIQDLTFAKEFRGLKGYRAKACVPALELTRRLMRKDPRAVPRNNERVRYVIVAGAPNQALIHCVRTPWELIDDPGLRPNSIYYVTRVIIPPLNRCLNLMGVDVNAWYREMPHRHILDNPVVQPLDKQKLTIFQYFGTIVCVSCGQSSNKGICKECLEHPADSLVVLHEKLRRLDRTYTNVITICQSCAGQTDTADCASLDCPILYRRAQAQRELTQATYLKSIITNGNNLEF